ncbi:MAG: TIGR04086 family membrane protein [Ammonifex sp.]|jgi:putative membrane protein (TIGR04086 family)|nr:MAG: TIGR04086 family membrane protein [Ammonifex sp.]
MTLKTDKSAANGFSLSAIGRGTLIGAVTSFGATVIVACLFYFTTLSEALLPYFVSFILFLSGVLGGSLASKQAGGKGLIHGTAVGIALFLILWLAAATVVPGPVTAQMLTQKLLLLISGGAVGGFIGVAFLL